jgi:uracil-DNA glycosylase
MPSNELTYLEDVEPTRKPTDAKTEKTVTTTTASVKVNNVQGTAVKRQRSIAEIFPTKAPSEAASSKRQKIDTSSSAVIIKKTVSGVAPLNSIPLNLDAFRASLTEEARDLLKLELENMGKSWYVAVIT